MVHWSGLGDDKIDVTIKSSEPMITKFLVAFQPTSGLNISVG